MRVTDSRTTRTASVAVTSAQNARVVSSRRSARVLSMSLLARLTLGVRRALERSVAAAGVDRPLHVEPRAPVVGHVGIQDLNDPVGLHEP